MEAAGGRRREEAGQTGEAEARAGAAPAGTASGSGKRGEKTRPPKDKHPAKPIPADDPPPAIPNYGGIEMVPMSAVLSAEDEDDSDDLPRR